MIFLRASFQQKNQKIIDIEYRKWYYIKKDRGAAKISIREEVDQTAESRKKAMPPRDCFRSIQPRTKA